MKAIHTVGEIVKYLETVAPLPLQESYDNAGLQTGSYDDRVQSALITLDVTGEVIDEAVVKNIKFIIAHHPVIFGGLKRLTGSSAVERVIIKAVKNGIAIYAAHTNLDSIAGGVNSMIARKIGLTRHQILQPAVSALRKLVTFIPVNHLEQVQKAVFEAGAGHIGNYDQCSYIIDGKGTFRGNDETNPFAGERGILHTEPEIRMETVFPFWLEKNIVQALISAHPYEEVAYDIYTINNPYPKAGMGLTGYLPDPLSEQSFLDLIKNIFNIPVIRHSKLTGMPVSKVAICGGAGAFLIKEAKTAGANVFITGDIKYHQFFDAGNNLLIADIGHFESEQFTKDLLVEILLKKFPTFAVHLSEVNTNPVNYY
jgi:dinuclear metal center YbgI/SA1388 family protein